LIEGMAHPTTKTTSKRDDILSRMRNLVANNRDKLFKKTDVKALADPIAKPVKEEELEVVEPEEVLEDEDGGTATY
jgi:hypothetical protein